MKRAIILAVLLAISHLTAYAMEPLESAHISASSSLTAFKLLVYDSPAPPVQAPKPIRVPTPPPLSIFKPSAYAHFQDKARGVSSSAIEHMCYASVYSFASLTKQSSLPAFKRMIYGPLVVVQNPAPRRVFTPLVPALR